MQVLLINSGWAKGQLTICSENCTNMKKKGVNGSVLCLMIIVLVYTCFFSLLYFLFGFDGKISRGQQFQTRMLFQ